MKNIPPVYKCNGKVVTTVKSTKHFKQLFSFFQRYNEFLHLSAHCFGVTIQSCYTTCPMTSKAQGQLTVKNNTLLGHVVPADDTI